MAARPVPVSASDQPVLPVRLAAELPGDEGCPDDLRALPRGAVAAAAEKGETPPLGRQLGVAANGSDDKVRQPGGDLAWPVSR